MQTGDDPIGALTIDEFAKTFKIGRTSTYRLIGAGKLRAVKVSRKTLVLVKDANDWAQSLPSLAASPGSKRKGPAQ